MARVLNFTCRNTFIEAIWPELELGLKWIEEYGDIDGDGFIEYKRSSEDGLTQQGWKDSYNSVFEKNGQLAKEPIALCEVQGYVYAAYQGASSLAKALKKETLANQLTAKAIALKKAFYDAFWCEEIGSYAFALDGDKKQCKVKSSNAGQCLFTEIAAKEHAEILVKTLFEKEMFSGWGIRTIGSKESLYNPMSYHNGSIWPHDNALIAMGLQKYGFVNECLELMTAFFDASIFFELQRLPELFCGFRRRFKEGPTPYPVACSPQAWAAGSVFLFLQAALGLNIHAQEGKIYFYKPHLPNFLDWLTVEQLNIGKMSCAFQMHKEHQSPSFHLLEKTGDIKVIIEQ